MANLPKTVGVVFRIPDGSGGTDVVPIDATITEQHTLTNTLTDHPVEKGANINDHSRPEPRRVTLECVQTNTPLTGADGTDRAKILWDKLVALHDSPQLIELSTARCYYKSMGIESVSSPVDVKTANALKFSVALKEVRVVQNKFTQAKPTKSPNGQSKKNAGNVTTKQTQPQGEEQSALDSIMHSIVGSTH